jgi:hypothetical protein
MEGKGEERREKGEERGGGAGISTVARIGLVFGASEGWGWSVGEGG